MTKKILILAYVCTLIFLFSPHACALKILPLIDASIGVGNSFFQDTMSSFGGDVYLDFIPVMRISENIDILPRFSLRYQGNRRLAELAGGGTLFQQGIDGNVSLKYIQRIGEELKFKFNAGFTKEWLRETIDEIWGKGLYDYNKSGAGIELDRGDIRGGYNFYMMRFPNYYTLASISETLVGREMVGKYVLDYNVNELYLAGKQMISEDVMGKYGYTYSRLDYIEQKVIGYNDGQYTSQKRYDNIHSGSANFTWFFPENVWGNTRVEPSFNLHSSLAYNQSNQNHFDPGKVLGFQHFYDYIQVGVSPSCNLRFLPGEIDLLLMYGYTNRSYLLRDAQDADGDKLPDKMSQHINSLTIYANYPVWDYFSIFFSTTLNGSISNNLYERYYYYNYSSGSYLVGVSFKY